MQAKPVGLGHWDCVLYAVILEFFADIPLWLGCGERSHHQGYASVVQRCRRPKRLREEGFSFLGIFSGLY